MTQPQNLVPLATMMADALLDLAFEKGWTAEQTAAVVRNPESLTALLTTTHDTAAALEQQLEDADDDWLYDAPASQIIIPIVPLPTADLSEFPTREAAEQFLAGCWLECYGPLELASDLELRTVAANFRASENVQLNW